MSVPLGSRWTVHFTTYPYCLRVLLQVPQLRRCTRYGAMRRVSTGPCTCKKRGCLCPRICCLFVSSCVSHPSLLGFRSVYHIIRVHSIHVFCSGQRVTLRKECSHAFTLRGIAADGNVNTVVIVIECHCRCRLRARGRRFSRARFPALDRYDYWLPPPGTDVDVFQECCLIM